MSRERVTIALDRTESSQLAATAERARRRGFRSFVVPSGTDLPFSPDEEVLRREGDHLLLPGGGAVAVPIVGSGPRPSSTGRSGAFPAGGRSRSSGPGSG